MKVFQFKCRKDFEEAVEIARAWSSGRHYCIDAKNKKISIEI